MLILTPSLNTGDASAHLASLISADIPVNRFHSAVRHLQRRFDAYAARCTTPFIAPGLIVTPEIRAQSELYLPIAEIKRAYNCLYSTALGYPPILSSTPFHTALSWADLFVKLPHNLQVSPNPSLLLRQLLADHELLTDFLCFSFLPRRFYGGLNRYPEQQTYIREWLAGRKYTTISCLDAACGTGEQTYGLALFFLDQGVSAEEIHVAGWTVEPLEIWAATYLRFPHDQTYEIKLRNAISVLFQYGYQRRISFCCHDILAPPPLPHQNMCFDLILCNGLLGGPIIHDAAEINRVVANLAQLLSPGGILLAADSFHDGWKRRCPQKALRASFEAHGLICTAGEEGLRGSKPDEQAAPG
ncbi:MAG: chemotaxis protein CheR [Desulfuromonadaceae bacterium]|nr:chemotaxis protein CheR [Desulfuromonadaceae bacterium]